MIQNADPPETAELLAFLRIVETKSLSRAAKELRIPRATISRRLSRLEQRLGARLLRRTTRTLSLTDAGEAFFHHARVALDSITRAQASVMRTDDDRVRGDLRVSVPPLTEDTFFAMVTTFAKKHPDVRVQIDFSSRLVDLHREGYDVALRATDKLEPGLVARTLGRHEVIGVASPRYLATHGKPKQPRTSRSTAASPASRAASSPRPPGPSEAAPSTSKASSPPTICACSPRRPSKASASPFSPTSS